MKRLVFIIILMICISILPNSQASLQLLCANSGVSCGMTPHSFWLNWKEKDSYIEECNEPGHDEFCEIYIVDVPVYSMCEICEYSFYEYHVEVSRKHVITQ